MPTSTQTAKDPKDPKDWPQTEATVESCSQHHASFSTERGFLGREYSIVFRYEVAGHAYTGEFECSDPWEVGKKFCIHYDPADPETNTMCDHKGERWVYIILAIAAITAIVAFLWIAHHYIR